MTPGQKAEIVDRTVPIVPLIGRLLDSWENHSGFVHKSALFYEQVDDERIES